MPAASTPAPEATLSESHTQTIVDVIVVAASDRYVKVRKYGTLHEAELPLASVEIIGIENSDAYRLILPASSAHQFGLL